MAPVSDGASHDSQEDSAASLPLAAPRRLRKGNLVLFNLTFLHELDEIPQVGDRGEDGVLNLSLLHAQLEDVFLDVVRFHLSRLDEAVGGQFGLSENHLGLLLRVLLYLLRRSLGSHERVS